MSDIVNSAYRAHMTDFMTHVPSKPQPSKIDRTLTISGYVITKRDRHWKVVDPKGELICIAVYKRGAREVVRRLLGLNAVGEVDTDRDV